MIDGRGARVVGRDSKWDEKEMVRLILAVLADQRCCAVPLLIVQIRMS